MEIENPHKVAFGRDKLLQSLIARIKSQFDQVAGDLVEPSLVVGLLGEWGSGKSYLLKQIEQEISKTYRTASAREIAPFDSIILPIAFNPWRFEAEEHLIVPLLMQTQFAIKRWREQKKDILEKLGQNVMDFLDQAQRELGCLAVAAASAFKFKLGFADVDLDKARQAFNQKQASAQQEKSKKAANPFEDSLTSIYYDFHDYLRKVTGRNGDQNKFKLNLLFLIDDIDRCLPEKAVRMLEAIKLFLDVEGCAFVLALDDEVVELGILHRYKDYLFNQQRQGEDRPLLPPITGTEYLEKMIHLPLRLPMPSKKQVREFLTTRFPDLFAQSAPTMDQPQKQDRAVAAENNALLNLFVDAVPPVPRKLVRAAELLALLLNVASASGLRQLNPVVLARLVILQCFAPTVYRHGRRYPEIMRTMFLWEQQYGNAWRKRQFIVDRLIQVEQEITSRQAYIFQEDNPQAKEKKQKLDLGAVQYLENVEEPLLQCIQSACRNRSRFDPRVIACGLEEKDLEEVRRCFNLVADAAESDAFDPAIEPDIDDREVARIENHGAFLDGLLSRREESWHAVLDNEALDGKTLDEALFAQVLKQLAELGAQNRPFLENDAWLARVGRHLRAQQWDRLNQLADLVTQKQMRLKQFQDEIKQNQKPQQQSQLTTTLQNITHYTDIPWSVGLKSALHTCEQALSTELLAIVENGTLEATLRAKVGDVLSQLGDARFDPQQHCLPVRYRAKPELHLGFVRIKGGPFWMGSNQNADPQADDDEMVDGKSHEVDAVPYDYWMARYPVTVQQYGAFMAAGGYENDTFWSTMGRAWRVKKHKSSAPRCHPDNWIEQERFSNRPVTGVSWYESEAYCRWLHVSLKNSSKTSWMGGKQIVRLPTEAEWVKAARAGDQRLYAWGNTWDSEQANVDTTIGHASCVGMYPQGCNANDLHDMTGNVWEWTHSGYRLYPFQNKQADWDERQVSDRLVARGGSWIDDQSDARCAVRLDISPDDDSDNLGFRVVVSLAF